MAHIKYYLKTETNNILDIKLHLNLHDLILITIHSDSYKEFLNIDISKQFQNSDFGGELTPAQLKYCANDVLYLHQIHEELNKILERK